MKCVGPFITYLAEYQLLIYIMLNVLTYWTISPSSDNAGSSRHFRDQLGDVSCTAAVGDGRANLKYKVWGQ
jgi:hypothetical protein